MVAYIKLCFKHERKILDVLTEEGLHVLAPLEVTLDLEDLPDLLRPLSLLLLLLQLLRRFYSHQGYHHKLAIDYINGRNIMKRVNPSDLRF